MSTSQSFRINALEENDVFLPAGKASIAPNRNYRLRSEPINLKESMNKKPRTPALSDSSNNHRGLSNNNVNTFQFKKPITVLKANKKKQVERSSSYEGDNKKEKAMKRQLSVPMFVPGNLDSYYSPLFDNIHQDDNELFPETEYGRQINTEDIDLYNNSPNDMIRDAEENIFFNVRNDLGDAQEATENVDQEEDINDDNYPEIERLPIGYSNYLIQDYISEWESITSSHVREQISISNPPSFTFNDPFLGRLEDAVFKRNGECPLSPAKIDSFLASPEFSPIAYGQCYESDSDDDFNESH